MIQDAYLGKFKLIITKGVSRFSRNILDTIAYTRELKTLGVGVIFMNDGFNSLEPDAELRLSIMGSIAQEESRKTSARVKWGQTRQMERGVVFGTSLLGYDVKEGKLYVNPEGAEVVRLIFHKYAVEKKGTTVIARELREAGLKTCTGNEVWSGSRIVKILRNEKYAGDLLQKKTITPDYLTHTRKNNRGEEEFITIKDHHEPIIDRELWNAAQEELQKRTRNRGSGSQSNRYVFSGKIICAECGAHFVCRRKVRKSGSAYMRWGCYGGSALGKPVSCNIGKTLRDELAMDALTQAIQSIPLDLEKIIRNLLCVIHGAKSLEHEEDPQKMENCIRQIRKKKEGLLDAFANGDIGREDFLHMNALYEKRITQVKEKLLSCGAENMPSEERLRTELENRIRRIVACRQVSVPLYKAVLEKGVIRKDGTFRISLKDLPQTFCFVIRYHKKQPHAVSSACV